MSHHLDHTVASDLSHRVLELRRQRGELTTPVLRLPHQRPQACVFDAYVADRPGITDGYQGEWLKRAVIGEGQ